MGQVTARISEAINNLGNDLTAAGWPAGDPNDQKFDTSITFRDLVIAATDVVWLESELRECANELCTKCGGRREGRCDGCRWKEVGCS